MGKGRGISRPFQANRLPGRKVFLLDQLETGDDALRVYGAADNVALFSARRGLDPRMSFTAASSFSYTALRTISGGIKVTF